MRKQKGVKKFFFSSLIVYEKVEKKKIQIEECILGNLLSFVSLFKENGEEYLLTFFLFYPIFDYEKIYMKK